ncbi:MAG: RtcB family protein, partial [Candidatus Obscuribacterales bacterium]|nr:RtcB family protein [Candidatus Obscuribacterales bacterium]
MSKQPDINYEVINSPYKKRTDNVEPVHIKAWIRGVALEDEARQQLVNLTTLPFIYKHVAVMPDAHMGKGSTIGSVIPTKNAIIPASVGVDLGCGMMAVRTSLTAQDLPDDLSKLRLAIERSVPHGRTNNGARGDRGAWGDLSGGTSVKKSVESAWSLLLPGFKQILESHPKIDNGHVNSLSHLGTLGTGNHFIEICLDEADNVWVMLHSGSRGVGNRIGTYFIELAKKEMEKQGVRLIDTDLAYLKEGSKYFDDYFHAVSWAQKFAFSNREIMMAN